MSTGSRFGRMAKRKKLPRRTPAQTAKKTAQLARRVARREQERIQAEKEQVEAERERISSLSLFRKLNWSKTHIETLRHAVASWLSTDAYRFAPSTNQATGRTVIRARITKPPAPELALMIGDSVHALRAALDHLALELVASYHYPAPVSPDLEETSEFVIIGGADPSLGEHRFDSAAGTKLRGIDLNARLLIKGMQPYHLADAYMEHPLWIIHELDRIDKHRRLNLTSYAFGGVGIGSGYIGELHLEKTGHNGPVVDGTEVAAFTARNSHFEMHFTGDIALAETSLWRVPVQAIQLLTRLQTHVASEVIPVLTPFLDRQRSPKAADP